MRRDHRYGADIMPEEVTTEVGWLDSQDLLVDDTVVGTNHFYEWPCGCIRIFDGRGTAIPCDQHERVPTVIRDDDST